MSLAQPATREEDALLTAAEADVLAHYRRIWPLWIRNFEDTPLVAVTYPDGFAANPTYIASLHHHPPSDIPTVNVTTHTGTHPYTALTEAALEWLVKKSAIEFHTWSPTRTDPLKAAFARIIITPHGRANETHAKEVLLALRTLLSERHLAAIPLLDGFDGAALWIPFADAPDYVALRAWLHAIVSELEARHPTLVTTAPPAERGDRVFVSAGSNAPGRFSALPYSLRGVDGLPLVLPIRWSELNTIANGDVTAATLTAHIAHSGDAFEEQAQAIDAQRFPAATHRTTRAWTPMGPGHDFAPRGRVIAAALQILSDGTPRDADELLAAALAQNLLPKTTTRKYIYSSLIEYVARAKGRDRKPLIVQDPDRRFRVNHPADDWPAPKSPDAQAPPDNAALIARLRAASSGDPEKFELAVCEAFTALGFRATHVGGPAAPDGYIDAQLGPLGYRAMLECKTGGKVVAQPDAFEAAKYRDAFGAQYATLIGPAFGDDVALGSELQTHGVSAWTVADLATVLTAGVSAFDLRPLFAPGFVAERLPDLLWDRDHGMKKRVTLVCEILHDVGRAEQSADAERGTPDTAPRLTEDAAMMLVDHELAQRGARQPCTRDIIRAAFTYLTNPRIATAVWTDARQNAIVITSFSP